MYCSQCGKKLNDDAQFCWYCGAKVQPVEEHREASSQTNNHYQDEKPFHRDPSPVVDMHPEYHPEPIHRTEIDWKYVDFLAGDYKNLTRREIKKYKKRKEIEDYQKKIFEMYSKR
ncbi:MAG: zinc ribbon domain-containing protein [Clostridia bacterium]|nr:zinc ribbon domain-containing protein [Clostridia bacterium]